MATGWIARPQRLIPALSTSPPVTAPKFSK